MASSAPIRCGGNCNLLDRRLESGQSSANQSARSCLLMVRSNGLDSSSRCRRGRIISAATTVEKKTPTPVPAIRLDSRDIESGGGGGGGAEAVAYEKLDEWMRESVVDIVKNVRKAPLIVQVYREKDKGDENDGVSARMVMEKAVAPEDWDAARGKWEAGEAPLPEGLIFVDELEERHEEDENDIGDSPDGVTRAWGVVIQGRGAECPPACYLLKTSTVMAGPGCGLGLGCTHFCLVRVNGFWETAESQLRNCWLVQAQAQALNKALGPYGC